jgi:hypothetical protein
MSKLLELFARRNAKRATRNGQTVLVTDNDPLLLEAFKELGWSDPYSDSEEVAVAPKSPERAVVPHRSSR